MGEIGFLWDFLCLFFPGFYPLYYCLFVCLFFCRLAEGTLREVLETGTPPGTRSLTSAVWSHRCDRCWTCRDVTAAPNLPPAPTPTSGSTPTPAMRVSISAKHERDPEEPPPPPKKRKLIKLGKCN